MTERLFRWLFGAAEDTTRAAIMMALAGAALSLLAPTTRRKTPRRGRFAAVAPPRRAYPAANWLTVHAAVGQALRERNA